jgi:hypothetical protein
LSGKFAEHFGFEQDDGSYKAWRHCQQGSVGHFMLEPMDDVVHYIPYLQAITLELRPDGHELTVLCASTGHRVFIEGRGLDDLAPLLAERRIRSIHQFDAEKHGNQTSGAAIVTSIKVEQSS